MKKLLVGILLISSTSAFATHAYRSEDCTSEVISLEYLGNYPFGGAYRVKGVKGAEEAFEAFPDYYIPDFRNSVEEADIVYEEKSSSMISMKAPTHDGCFQHTENETIDVIVIKSISDKAQEELGLSVNQKIELKCINTLDIPVGPEC
jgi:hypothetical protein